jgi:NADP-dependent 3-hydroxy acid dehydrogenase YdfG
VSRPEDCEALVQAAITEFGGLDVIVVNAGVGFYGSILDHTESQIRSMLDTNINGTVWSVRAALPALMERGAGDIVIVCSVAGRRAGLDEAVYAATKHAQMGLAQGLDRDLHHSNIRVTAICPGGVVTEFAMGEGRTPESAELELMLSPQHVAAVILGVVDQPRSVRTLVHSLRGIHEPDA